MDGNRLKELEQRERNELNSPLEKEELELMHKLQENVDKQNAEAAKKQEEALHDAAVEGDGQAQVELENREIEKRNQKIRDDVQKDLDRDLRNKDAKDGDTVAEQQEIQAKKDEQSKKDEEHNKGAKLHHK